MKRFASALVVLAGIIAAAGCSHAQLPPTKGYNVEWTVTLSAPSSSWNGCVAGQPACGIVISTLVVPAGTSTCPASTGSNYVAQQTTATAIQGTSWTQDNTTGTTQCAVAQIVQTQAGQTAPSISAVSPVSNAVASPALPLAPGITGGSQQSAALVKPAFPALQPTAGEKIVATLEIRGRLVQTR